MIGSLMYLTALRPDIMFAVNACLRHQVTPTTSNLESVKKIFKYLKGQPKLGLWYPKESRLVLEAYSDSDYVRANKDRKSTTGGCQFLDRRLISWQCKKQTIMATSSTEAEYVAAANCCGQEPYATFTCYAQAGKGAEVAARDVPHQAPALDQSPTHFPTPSRPQSPDPVAPVLKHDHSSAQPKTAAGSFPNTEDAPLGGEFHTSPSRSSHAPLQKVHSLEAKLHDHKKLFKDVVGKLVKKVKSLEVKLKTKKRKLVISDSDLEDSTIQDMDLDAL
nr:uncharacterized mitochondrial protein AtMg00810-like [Tanacetum cinerariifolium]